MQVGGTSMLRPDKNNFFERRNIMKTLTTLIIVLGMASFATAALQDGLVAHWTFDEGTGTIAHDSAGSNDGVIHDATWTTGKFGGALFFDGDEDYVTVPDDDSLTPHDEITISWWVFRVSSQDAGIFKYAFSPNEQYSPGNSRSLYFSMDRLGICAAVNTIDEIYFNGPSLNEWHHIVGTFNRGQAAIYIDGELKVSETLYVSSIMNDVQPLIIGGCWDYGGADRFASALNGLADDIRIYNRALSAAEVAQLYAIPEPATLILIGLGWVMLRKRQARQVS